MVMTTSNENNIFLIYSTNFKFNMGASLHAPFIWRNVFLGKRATLPAKSHLATIGDKIIVQPLYSNRVTTENKRIHTSVLSPSFKVGVFVVVCRWLINSGTTLQRGDGGGKALFATLEVSKTSESPFRVKSLKQILSPIVALI